MKHIADLFLFMGQSNMAGRGITCSAWPQTAPRVPHGMGYEFRAISDPTRLYPMGEPFGKDENRLGGINDGIKKTGSMVSAFTCSYTERCGIPVVGVSASKGGSALLQWQPGSIFLTDAIERFHRAEAFLREQGWEIRHRYVLWCQGETDGDLETSEHTFKDMFRRMTAALLQEGIEELFLVLIGQRNLAGWEERYEPVRKWERELAEEMTQVTLVSERFGAMAEQGLMKDTYHYYQEGYNRVGKEAGERTAEWVRNRELHTTEDLERRLREDLRRIGANTNAWNRNGTLRCGEAGAGSMPGRNVFIKDGSFHCIDTGDYGKQEETIFDRAGDLLQKVYEGAAFELAIKYELSHRKEGQDFRRILFARELELLRILGETYYEKGKEKIESILAQYPYNDNQ